MKIRQIPSPNFGKRIGFGAPDMIILHYTAMETAEGAIERLCDPVAEVSAHYVIDETGQITQLVAEENRAWHAGVSAWEGVTDINSCSIGIELANPGPLADLPPFPEPQMAALERLIADISLRWDVPFDRILGHEHVAPGRKFDPGPKFDWLRIAGRVPDAAPICPVEEST